MNVRSFTILFVTSILAVVVGQEDAGVPPPIVSVQSNTEEVRAEKFIEESEEAFRKITEEHTYIEWAYESNINDENEKKKMEYQEVFDAFSLKLGNEAKQFQLDQIQNKDLLRKLKWLRDIGTSALAPEKLKKYHESSNARNKIYSTAKVPSYDNTKTLFSLEPEITEAMAVSRDPKELEYYWNEWHKASGGKMRDHFLAHIELINEAARLNGYKDATEMKIQPYESKTFVKEMADTWEGLKPLYVQIHAYVRAKLLQKYGYNIIDPMGPIPAHLLGNMWAQSWTNLANMLRPYPNKPGIDVTPAMKEQGWTQKIMFQKAEEFFISLGLEPMTEEFWNGSIIEKPEGRELVCHASAWDFYNGKDFRIKQCTKVTSEDFVTVNHEMGHIQYQMSYRNLSFLFRDGANPGFHEGIADILSLAVGTASYFKQLGLIPENVNIEDEETDINILFEMALQRLVFLPFSYLVDKYRWDMYSGEASTKDLNCHWVKLRLDIQGVAPPNQRNEAMFDAGAKYHVAANSDYVNYFTAHIYEFQFYKTLCLVSGKYEPGNPAKPLHRCNFYGSKEAGSKLHEMLALGKSKPWKEIMEIMTGTPNMDTAALREYFAPLEKWLIKTNEEQNNQVGWTVKNFEKFCVSSSSNRISTNIFGILFVSIFVTLNFL